MDSESLIHPSQTNEGSLQSPSAVASLIDLKPTRQPDSDLVPNTVLMFRPIDFVFNDQTAGDNEFQHKVNLEAEQITIKAIKEFDEFVELLRSKGINVIVHDKSQYKELLGSKTPDSVFPNNWISTDIDGFVYTYPMFAPNRRAEKLAFSFVEKQLLDANFQIRGTFNLGTTSQNSNFLEGTGSMIIDRQGRVAYAAKSLRTDEETFQEYCKIAGYEAVAFDTESSNGKAYYHTNMILCIGDTFVVICKEGIKSSDRDRVMEKLKSSGKEIIEISKEQAEKSCSGNVLQVKSQIDSNKKYLVMSQRAFNGFTPEQKKTLEKHAEIVYANIDTIEEIGGGSARCMMCEIYLPKSRKL